MLPRWRAASVGTDPGHPRAWETRRVRIDLSPLLRGERGETIRVAGVRVGDPAASVDRGALTHAAADPPGESGQYRGGSAYDTGFTKAEGVKEALLEAAVRGSGFLQCGDASIRVMDGAIEQIFVRGPSLASLGIAREVDLEQRFGAAIHRERRLGRRIHHYPARGLVVACNEDDRLVAHVALGEAPRLGAKDLLSELLLGFFALERAGWAEPPDGSARVRYRRIAALARALGLGSGTGAVADLVRGKFLEGQLEARRGVLEEIAAHGEYAGDSSIPSATSYLFESLLRYRHDVGRVVRVTAGWLCCSDPGLLGMIGTQDRLGRRFEAMMADVDRWLCTLMDPEHRTFELRELIARHGWPDVDLYALEMEEI